MTEKIHFVPLIESPVLSGVGDETLFCDCGAPLIGRYQPVQFLAVGIQCARCGAVTTTPSLADGAMPPGSLIVAEPSLEPRAGVMTVPAGTALVGRAEMERLGGLLRPATPADWSYVVSAELLDRAAASFEHLTGDALPSVAAEAGNAFAGLRDHALGWSVQHLRGRIRDGSWACLDDAPTSNAVLHVTAFLHFVATWSRHPLFSVMMGTVAEHRFSLHGLALFAAAHSMALMGNRVGFQAPAGYPERIDCFDLATGPTEVVRVRMDVFDRFEFPFGRKWDKAALEAAVAEVVAAVRGRINLRNPGVLLLSPGTALAGYDEALIEAVKAAMQAEGRKNRGLMAVAPIMLRLQALDDPHNVRFGYGLFPIVNKHYSGDAPVENDRGFTAG